MPKGNRAWRPRKGSEPLVFRVAATSAMIDRKNAWRKLRLGGANFFQPGGKKR
jgi:hypothetical protein